MPNDVVRKPFQSTKWESRCVAGEMAAFDMERYVETLARSTRLYPTECSISLVIRKKHVQQVFGPMYIVAL